MTNSGALRNNLCASISLEVNFDAKKSFPSFISYRNSTKMTRPRGHSPKEHEEEYEVDAIIDKHVTKSKDKTRKIQYLIQWAQGGDSKWIPLEELVNCSELIAEYENRTSRAGKSISGPARDSESPDPLLPSQGLAPASGPSASLLKWEFMQKIRDANGRFDTTRKFYRALVADIDERARRMDQLQRELNTTIADLMGRGLPGLAEELASLVDNEAVARPGHFMHTILLPGGELQLRGLDRQDLAERARRGSRGISMGKTPAMHSGYSLSGGGLEDIEEQGDFEDDVSDGGCRREDGDSSDDSMEHLPPPSSRASQKVLDAAGSQEGISEVNCAQVGTITFLLDSDSIDLLVVQQEEIQVRPTSTVMLTVLGDAKALHV